MDAVLLQSGARAAVDRVCLTAYILSRRHFTAVERT